VARVNAKAQGRKEAILNILKTIVWKEENERRDVSCSCDDSFLHRTKTYLYKRASVLDDIARADKGDALFRVLASLPENFFEEASVD
jgi:hypothetical protein